MLNSSHCSPFSWRYCGGFPPRIALCCLSLLLLNGCASLAVSLAGAGAGVGIAHQMNGTASRTFSQSLEKVDAATHIAAARMSLKVEGVDKIDSGQITRARLSNMDITLELETLSPNVTRVDVTARKDWFRVDGATAQEIVVQIQRALDWLEQRELAQREAAAATANNALLELAPTATGTAAPASIAPVKKDSKTSSAKSGSKKSSGAKRTSSDPVKRVRVPKRSRITKP